MLGIYLAMGFVEIGIVAGLVKPFLVEAFVMPTKSMSPTINPDDRFIVNRLLRPRRWDLVAYRNNGPHPEVYCKRVIGLPGEKLRFDHGNIFINDHLVTPPPVLAGHLRAFPGETQPAYFRYKEGETITLGDNQYFFVGDNIDISADSRMYGPSDRSSLVGVVDVIYWPVTKIRILR
jgi:signal peptidase I